MSGRGGHDPASAPAAQEAVTATTAWNENPASRARAGRSAPIVSLVRNAGSFLPLAKCRAGV
jgi:hypothetical protein